MISLTKHLNVWCIKNAYFIFLIRNEDKAVENLQTYQILDILAFNFQPEIFMKIYYKKHGTTDI